MEYILAPSILSADFKTLGEQMKITEENGARYVHFDVMDGMFVPSISFGMPVLKSISKATGQVMDVHLMVQDPIRYVEAFKEAGADILTVHLEACKDVKAVIGKIRECGMKAGLSVCPETAIEEAEGFLADIDMLLIMSVHPGFGGQKFIPASLDKIKKARQMAGCAGLSLDIEVDGGIYHENVREVLDAGANVIVAGSAVFKGNVGENTSRFVDILGSYARSGHPVMHAPEGGGRTSSDEVYPSGHPVMHAPEGGGRTSSDKVYPSGHPIMHAPEGGGRTSSDKV